MVRFWTYDEAHLFASRKRADGYFAEVIHQNAGHIWGGCVARGFPVVVSEDVISEDAPEPVVRSDRPSELALVVFIFGIMGFALSLLSFLLMMYMAIVSGVHDEELMVSLSLHVALLVALLPSLYGAFKLTRIYNRPEHGWYSFARIVIGAVTWVLIIMPL